MSPRTNFSPDRPANGFTLLVPGDLEAQTGGYIYDRRIVYGLGTLGWEIEVHSLDVSFPQPTTEALAHARKILADILDGSIVVIDGLALGGLSSLLEEESERLCLVALIHHPVSLETGLDTETAQLLQASERTALMYIRRVVVTSHWTSRKLNEFGVAADLIRVVTPGVDVLSSGTHRGKARMDTVTRTGVCKRSVNLLCVATLIPRKGHNVLFDALALLGDRPWHLNCVGSQTRDPKTTERLCLQITELGLERNISLLGEVDRRELDSLYAGSDLFVLASHLEGYGMALVEAIAAGIPVVSTLAGAIPESVPKNASVLVPPKDSGAFAEGLIKIMDNPEGLQKMKLNALRACSTLPSWRETSKHFADALEGLVSKEL